MNIPVEAALKPGKPVPARRLPAVSGAERRPVNVAGRIGYEC
jgi:hypothetical protein